MPQFLHGHVPQKRHMFTVRLRGGLRGVVARKADFPVALDEDDIGMRMADDRLAHGVGLHQGLDEEVPLVAAHADFDGDILHQGMGVSHRLFVNAGKDFKPLLPVAANQRQRHGEMDAVLPRPRDADAARILEDIAAHAHPHAPATARSLLPRA